MSGDQTWKPRICLRTRVTYENAKLNKTRNNKLVPLLLCFSYYLIITIIMKGLSIMPIKQQLFKLRTITIISSSKFSDILFNISHIYS